MDKSRKAKSFVYAPKVAVFFIINRRSIFGELKDFSIFAPRNKVWLITGRMGEWLKPTVC